MKKYTYYFICEDQEDNDICYDLFDDDAWIDRLINSACITYCLKSDKEISSDEFNDMVCNSIINIFSGKSETYDYPQDFYKYDLWDQIDDDDVLCEMSELYDVEIYSSIVPLIWGDDCWADDKNYDQFNPPELWRLTFDYGKIDEEKYREGANF